MSFFKAVERAQRAPIPRNVFNEGGHPVWTLRTMGRSALESFDREFVSAGPPLNPQYYFTPRGRAVALLAFRPGRFFVSKDTSVGELKDALGGEYSKVVDTAGLNSDNARAIARWLYLSDSEAEMIRATLTSDWGEFRQRDLWLPTAEQRAKIRKAQIDGQSLNNLAYDFGVSISTMRRWISLADYTSPPTLKDRQSAAVLRMTNAGYKVFEIATATGLTSAEVSSIARKVPPWRKELAAAVRTAYLEGTDEVKDALRSVADVLGMEVT